MPELPDIVVYVEALESRILDEELADFRVGHPFLLRTVEPKPTAFAGRRVTALERVGKRVALGFEDDLWAVLHLMIAGRLHWRKAGASIRGKRELAAFDFAEGSLILTEAGSKKRASLHLLKGARALDGIDPGGLEVLDASVEEFREALTRRNHTLKRALTDPTLFSGIGNAYSDEILHRARLSPVTWSQRLESEAIERLFAATRAILGEWTERLRSEAGGGFPEKVTAFRPEMAVHGKYQQPCPECGSPVQRIRYASNETNYCASCQTRGKLLADRSLSRLLKQDWPRSMDELDDPPG
jgi:formamidopyrimidine-DNA glycosylase